MIIDENYAKRANDHTSKTGVSYENQLIESTYKDNPKAGSRHFSLITIRVSCLIGLQN